MQKCAGVIRTGKFVLVRGPAGGALNAGVSRHTYYRLEKGISRKDTAANPSLQIFIAIAAVFEASVADLLPAWRPELKP